MSNVADTHEIDVPAGCPVAHWFRPTDTASHPEPFGWYEQVRQVGPIVYAPEPGWYVITRYKEVTDVLRNTTTYSNAGSLGESPPTPGEIAAEVGESWTFPEKEMITVTDPPQHTRLRKLLVPSFSPRRIGMFEDLVREIVDERLDVIADRGKGDLAADFAYRIPSQIIARILGADADAADKFQAYVEAFAVIYLATLPPEQQLDSWRLLIECDQYGRTLIDARRRCPADDIMTDWINATTEDGDPALTDEELVSNVLGFLMAGTESSAILMIHAMLFLLSNPEQWEQVKSDPALIPAALEETLRLRGPVRGLIREVLEDTELGGVTLRKGDHVYLSLQSANNDDQIFEQPEKFDINRPNLKQHIGFGKWAHFCPGSPLARLEGKIALERLVERMPNLRLAPDYAGSFGYASNHLLMQAQSLQVEWD